MSDFYHQSINSLKDMFTVNNAIFSLDSKYIHVLCKAETADYS
jgi:hypothetical protein